MPTQEHTVQRIEESDGHGEATAAQPMAPYTFQGLLDRNAEKQGLDLAPCR
jgi:hypothetical protein